MTEPTPDYTTNGRTQSYYLTPAERRYLERFQQMQNKATLNRTPCVLMVFFDGRTVSFYNGNPSGIVRDE